MSDFKITHYPKHRLVNRYSLSQFFTGSALSDATAPILDIRSSVGLEPVQDLLRHCHLCLGGARNPTLTPCKLRFLCSVRTQLPAGRNDLEQALKASS
jgi:hypothetical protein